MLAVEEIVEDLDFTYVLGPPNASLECCRIQFVLISLHSRYTTPLSRFGSQRSTKEGSISAEYPDGP